MTFFIPTSKENNESIVATLKSKAKEFSESVSSNDCVDKKTIENFSDIENSLLKDVNKCLSQLIEEKSKKSLTDKLHSAATDLEQLWKQYEHTMEEKKIFVNNLFNDYKIIVSMQSKSSLFIKIYINR